MSAITDIWSLSKYEKQLNKQFRILGTVLNKVMVAQLHSNIFKHK
jgi:hypothetical protein